MNPQAVKFETGMRLKEKGFDVPTDYGYDSKGGYYQDENFKVNYNGDPYTDLVCSAPTIAEVVMWLYEKHGIWISVQRDWDFGNCLGFEATIDGDDGSIDTETFNSPTEAYEAAIKYTLENLI